MSTRQPVAIALAACAALFASALILRGGESAPAPAVPEDTLILDAADASNVTRPFAVRSDPSAAGRGVLILPEGAGTMKQEGSASLTLQVRKEGTYHAWMHTRWQDSCGNSVTLRVDTRPGYAVGQDRIYRTWHWVKAGRHPLTEGTHTITLGEREDGVAINQVLFTPDKTFRPAGFFTTGGVEIRRFADDFARSPGHGMKAWDLFPGGWEIVFSFDPNRIPNQYALHGAAPGRPTTALLEGPPWEDCLLAFSLYPQKPGTCGAVLDRSDDGAASTLVGLQTGSPARLIVKNAALDTRVDIGPALRLNQWHRVTIDRRASTLRVCVDGRSVFESADCGPAGGRVGLIVVSGEAVFDDVELSQAPSPPGDTDPYFIGPYHFTRAQIQDPSDYLDFTREEYEKMRVSPAADKLVREAKHKPLVAGAGSMSPWVTRGGAWHVQNGILTGTGEHAILRHAQQIASDGMDLRARVRLNSSDAEARIEFYGGSGTGPSVLLSRAKDASAGAGVVALRPPRHGGWHDLHVTIKDGALSARLDRGKEQRIDMTTPDGEYVTLEVRGSVSFDDIEFAVPRRTDTSFLYTFDRRETDWWREGGEWIDHGGFACVLASSWISLIAPKGRGYLWNKHLFASDIAVSFNVHENSEWFGWRARPQHVHYPYDNICVVLSPEENADRGYRLEVNADNRSRTVLYRNGTAVRTVSQKKGYPIRYVGGHAPYAPRNNRIGLIRRGATFIAVVNGVEVLRYEDAEPLPTSRVGIGGYRTRANFSHVEIRR